MRIKNFLLKEKNILDEQGVLMPDDFIKITGTIDDKVNVPLMRKYFEEYQRTIAYGLPKEYYLGYIKGLYNQMKNECEE